MPEIKLKNITKRWGNFYAVDDVNLDIKDNSFITLLGPSGCGKTTILRMIAGLETPTAGRIEIGGKVVFDSEKGINIPANKRKVGFLFQNYALWPNMTVYQNITFGLTNIKEEMPVYDFDAVTRNDILRALKNANKIKTVIEDCKDKNGSIDKDRAYLKLIDSFTLSMFTAKELFDLGIHLSDNPQKSAEEKAREYEKKMDSIVQSHKSKGETLNEDFAVLKDGQIRKEVRKLHKEEIEKTLRYVSGIVKIGMFMDRYPAELSGGQQQRVAIARTLAPKPEVLFMDEPLSNLDAKLRQEMRYELQRLHVETGSTFVYVTHDQMEAMTLATKICLIENGVLQQYDAPLDVYNRPNNTFVADFVGNPSINFIETIGKQEEDGSISLEYLGGLCGKFIPEKPVDINELIKNENADEEKKFQTNETKQNSKHYVEKSNKDELFRYHIAKVDESEFSASDSFVVGDNEFVIGVRPEYIAIGEDCKTDAMIYAAMPTGMETTVKLKAGDFLLTGVVFGGALFTIGNKIKFSFKGKDILLFSKKSGRLICAGQLQ